MYARASSREHLYNPIFKSVTFVLISTARGFNSRSHKGVFACLTSSYISNALVKSKYHSGNHSRLISFPGFNTTNIHFLDKMLVIKNSILPILNALYFHNSEVIIF